MQSLRLGSLDDELGDDRAPRALATPLRQRLDGVLGTFGDHLDGAVGEVSSPPADTEALRFAAARRPVEDALHPTVDNEPPRHHVGRAYGPRPEGLPRAPPALYRFAPSSGYLQHGRAPKAR